MKILAIETSCDETGIALVEGYKTPQGVTFAVLKNALLSQAALHAEFGGVYPNLAKREHEKNLPLLFKEFENEDVDAIAVTRGPGLEPALWTGVGFAKKLAAQWHKPLLPMNHMEGHLISSLITHTHPNKLEHVGMSGELHDVALPVLALLISGGHTEFILMKEWFKYEMVGETQDDAVGEAFDKVARMLALPYPGGPEISRLAEERRSQATRKQSGLTGEAETGDPRTFSQESGKAFILPRPMIHDPSCDFSFAGLKTSVLYLLKDHPDISESEKRELALEFENACAEVLWAKTARAIEQTGAQTLVLGGGVSNNIHIRRVFAENISEKYSNIELRLPAHELTTDNAVMIALAGFYRSISAHGKPSSEIRANGNQHLA